MNELFRLHPGTLLEGDIQGQIIDYQKRNSTKATTRSRFHGLAEIVRNTKANSLISVRLTSNT